MQNMGFSIVAAAALFFSLPARANDAAQDRESMHEDAYTATAVPDSTIRSQNSNDFLRNTLKPDDAIAGAGSGEPTLIAPGTPNNNDFLRNVWTTP